jgi:hypothetical protein
MSMGVLSEALALGLPVFPCRNTPGNPGTDKHPLTLHGFKDASAEPAAIRAMFGTRRNCLIGVPTGEASGLDVLDIDPRSGGGSWYHEHKERLPATRIHRTRSGGLHLLFRHLDGLRNSSGKIAPGVDVRAGGGYIVWWPCAGLGFKDYPPSGLPDWPGWLLMVLLEPPRPPRPQRPPAVKNDFSPHYVLAAYERELRAVASAANGTRNASLHLAAIKLGTLVAAGALARSDVESALFNAASVTGLPAIETLKTIENGMRFGLERPRSVPKTKRRGHAV